MAFRGWPVEAIEFFEGLEADNSKPYWTDNRSVYDELVLAPMRALLLELAPEFGEGKVFRPYRDVRFSADKTPYKTSIAASFAGGYVHLSAAGLGAGSGLYMMSPDQLDRYRHAVVDDRSGAELEALRSAITARGIEVRGHEILKRTPRGFAPGHPRDDLLRCKGLIAWQSWAPGPWLGSSAAKRRLVAFYRTAAPLGRWLTAHVGVGEDGDASR